MKILLGLALLLNLHLSVANATEVRLSQGARISILTCSPGPDLYSVFGHSAIRVEDPAIGVDIVFNYGTFDFSDPNFYTNFVRGKLNYVLSIDNYKNFLYTYLVENRSIIEQELSIDQGEKQWLMDSLLINYRPENRGYLYDFFLDNCATRIRDIVYEALPRPVNYSYQGLEEGQTFRQLITPYLLHMPWTRLGINLLLGLPTDRVATPWEYMFLPDHLMTVIKHSTIGAEDQLVNLTYPAAEVLPGSFKGECQYPNNPFWVFTAILLIGIALSGLTYRKIINPIIARWFDGLLFLSVGLLGILLTFMCLGTDHSATLWNLNLLWAHPFWLVLLFIGTKPLSRFRRVFLGTILATTSITLVAWPIIPQELPWHILPLVVLLAVRVGCRLLDCCNPVGKTAK